MLVVTDFDGTVIRKNSFPMWILFILKMSLKKRRWEVLFSVVFLLFKRKVFGIIDHSEFKRKINALDIPDAWALSFCLKLTGYLSGAVVEAIKGLNLPVVVTTAAPECYAKYIPDVLNFNVLAVLSSGVDSRTGLYVDNVREEKLNVFKNNFGVVDVVFFSDHQDDLCFAKFSKKFYLCNPKREALDFFEKESFCFAVVEDAR